MRYRQHRYVSDRMVRVSFGAETETVRLSNISTTGARVSGLRPLEPGQRVNLCQRHFQVPAKVVWSNSQQTGLVFLEALSPAGLQEISGTLGQSSGPSGGWHGHGFRELR
ncbi:PilZ domain-containing protein [Hyphomonas sp.]|uniref:PilZ domain-containing protein n=1 Tax=Hyphomonas sp. TaxID=87 RepID=UPI0032636694